MKKKNGSDVRAIVIQHATTLQAIKKMGHLPDEPKRNGSVSIYRCVKCHASAVVPEGPPYPSSGTTPFGTALSHGCDPVAVDKRLRKEPWCEKDQADRDLRLKKERAERIAAKRVP